jgi:uncharacterized protein (DUF2345 family)
LLVTVLHLEQAAGNGGATELHLQVFLVQSVTYTLAVAVALVEMLPTHQAVLAVLAAAVLGAVLEFTSNSSGRYNREHANTGGGGGGDKKLITPLLQLTQPNQVAAQASSSFHTQAQHNYLVVALLPNQAVTSFTHSHLLAHLALCHL